MTDSELSDDDLLRQARVRPDIFAHLDERHARSVHSYLRRRVGAAFAEDLLGEVFVAALAARMRVIPHESGSALPWLYGIAGNLVRAHLRRAQRIEAGTRAGADRSDEATVDWDAVDDRLDAGTRIGELRAVLVDLTGGERELLLLVAWEGLTPAEAGLALGLTPVVARSRLFRARTRARASLAARQPVGPPKGTRS